jgi:DNA replication protein DnaC
VISKEIQKDLNYLRLYYTAEHFEKIIRDNSHNNQATFLENLIRLEIVEKKSRSIQQRMRNAKLGRFEKMNQFDWNWPKEIDRDRIESMLNLEFLTNNRNIIFIGAQGLGKTMISKNIVCNAVNRGYKGVFSSASRIVADLLHSGRKMEAAIKKYTSPDVLVIDELGYLSFEQKAADVLFEVISRRYENKPIILTTNLAFSEWPTIFPGAACVTALVDRLTHNADIIRVSGPSYRTKRTKS